MDDTDQVELPKRAVQQAINLASDQALMGTLIGSIIGGMGGLIFGRGGAQIGQSIDADFGYFLGGVGIAFGVVLAIRALTRRCQPWYATFATMALANALTSLGARWIDEHAGWRLYHWAAMGLLCGIWQGASTDFHDPRDEPEHEWVPNLPYLSLRFIVFMFLENLPNRLRAILAGGYGGLFAGALTSLLVSAAGWTILEDALGSPYVLIAAGCSLGFVSGLVGGARTWTRVTAPTRSQAPGTLHLE
jgi:hypothetical protein